MRVVAALGGNALLRRGEPMTLEAHWDNVTRAAAALAPLAGHGLVVTHGNGPQVGWLALQAEALADGPRMPLDVLGAESEGWIGTLLDRALSSVLPHRRIATLLTQTLVDPEDPAFSRPTKPIGPVYPLERGRALAAERGWAMAADGGGLRRVVPSPAPAGIVEAPTVRLLLDAGVVVICAGGGGVPVTLLPDLILRGVEAVVDKDAASALLAREIGADALLLLTDVAGVYAGPDRTGPPLATLDAATAAALDLPAGSMGPKVAAALSFARGGGFAAIGRLEDAAAVLRGEAGTRVRG